MSSQCSEYAGNCESCRCEMVRCSLLTASKLHFLTAEVLMQKAQAIVEGFFGTKL